MYLAESGSASVHRRSKTVLPATILFHDLKTGTAVCTLNQSGEYVTVLHDRMQATSIPFAGIIIHDPVDTFPHFRINQRIKDTFLIDNSSSGFLRRGRFLGNCTGNPLYSLDSAESH